MTRIFISEITITAIIVNIIDTSRYNRINIILYETLIIFKETLIVNYIVQTALKWWKLKQKYGCGLRSTKGCSVKRWFTGHVPNGFCWVLLREIQYAGGKP